MSYQADGHLIAYLSIGDRAEFLDHWKDLPLLGGEISDGGLYIQGDNLFISNLCALFLLICHQVIIKWRGGPGDFRHCRAKACVDDVVWAGLLDCFVLPRGETVSISPQERGIYEIDLTPIRLESRCVIKFF